MKTPIGQPLPEIDPRALATVAGGAGPTPKQWEAVRDQARPYCPDTVARHQAPPASRAQGKAMGAACLDEMGPLQALVARPRINAAIDKAFPR